MFLVRRDAMARRPLQADWERTLIREGWRGVPLGPRPLGR